MIFGDMGDGVTKAMRVSLPGYDVLAEALGSRNISFDSRLTDIGTVVACGLIQCGGGGIAFPAMDYVPIFSLKRFDGTDLYSPNEAFTAPTGGLASGHTWAPVIGIVTNSTLQCVAYQSSNYNTFSLYNPTGQYFMYSVFANSG